MYLELERKRFFRCLYYCIMSIGCWVIVGQPLGSIKDKIGSLLIVIKLEGFRKTLLANWKGSHHRIPFHFKYGWFTPSYTTNDTKLWKASQR